jgi:hypothetical protein
VRIQVDRQHAFLPLLGALGAEISRERYLANTAFEIGDRQCSRVATSHQ